MEVRAAVLKEVPVVHQATEGAWGAGGRVAQTAERAMAAEQAEEMAVAKVVAKVAEVRVAVRVAVARVAVATEAVEMGEARVVVTAAVLEEARVAAGTVEPTVGAVGEVAVAAELASTVARRVAMVGDWVGAAAEVSRGGWKGWEGEEASLVAEG